MSDDPGLELVVPFVCVASKGGPFDDAPFVAGVQLGAIWNGLRARHHISTTALVDERLEAQCDLVAMACGYAITVIHRGAGNVLIGFTRITETAP